VFGTSMAAITEGSKKGELKIIVKGEKNELLGYSLR
jgi:hypothetical protein